MAGVAAWVATWLAAGELTAATVALHLLWIAPAEELFFRGLLQGEARERLGRLPAIAIGTTAFAISHAVLQLEPLALATAAPALLFAAARERHHSLLGPVLLHATANLSLMLWFGVLR